MKQESQQPFTTTHILKKHEMGGLTLFEALYPPRLKQPRHTHTQASLSFVLTGSYVEDYGLQARTRKPSTLIFHPPQEAHAVDFQSEAVRILSVQFDRQRLDYIRERSIVLDASASCRTEMVSCLGHRIYQEFRRMDIVSALAIEGLVFEILAEVSRSRALRSERKSPRWLAQAREFLHDNFSESLTLGDVASAVGVHPVHLARVFRQQTGRTIGEYIRRLRVEFAYRQISFTKLPLGEIALAAGFADQSHLTKTFKTYFGLTPSECRRMSRTS